MAAPHLLIRTVDPTTAPSDVGVHWVNTTLSNTGSAPYIDGTGDNPVSTWAAALLLSPNIG